jgi:capsular polysaccharide biosynthesis protein
MALKFIRRFAYRVALAAFVAVWTICFAIRTYPTFFPPTCYLSTAVIELHGAGANPDLMQKQVEIIRSSAILNPVIEKLDLNKFWVQYLGLPSGFMLKQSEILEILTNQLNVVAVTASTQIKIEDYSEKPNESALIANGVAETYRDFMAEKQSLIQVQIVDRAQPALHPWMQSELPLLVADGMTFATLCGAVAAVLAICGMMLLRKILAIQIARPVVSNFTGPRIFQKY